MIEHALLRLFIQVFVVTVGLAIVFSSNDDDE